MSFGHARLFLTLSRGLIFLFTGTLRTTNWLGQSQLKYLPWSSCLPCESSLLFYLVLIRASQHFSFNECWPCAPPNTLFKRSAFRHLNQNKLRGSIPAQISALVALRELCALTLLFSVSQSIIAFLVLISVGWNASLHMISRGYVIN